MTKYERGHELDRRMILDALDGKPLSRYPCFHAKGIPTYRGALELARKHGITRSGKVVVSRTLVNRYQNPYYIYQVSCEVVMGNRSLWGASQDPDAYIALERSFQNGVRQLLPQQGAKLVWRDKAQNAIRYA